MLVVCPVWAMTFTEFYCKSGYGTNVSSGSTTDATNVFYSNTGNWTNSTFTWHSTGTPDLSLVAVGQWASVYTNTATNAVFIAKIIAVDDVNDTITLTNNSNGFMGTAPANDTASAEGTTAIRVGGCWSGPHHASGFPFTLMANTATNAPAYLPRVNFQNSSNYVITSAVNTMANVGPIVYQGYSVTPGDMGRATIVASAANGFTAMTLAGFVEVADFNITTTVSGGSSGVGITTSSNGDIIRRVKINGFRGIGLNIAGVSYVDSAEVYDCAKNGANPAVVLPTGSRMDNSVIRNNVSGSGGVILAGNGASINNCLVYGNVGPGIYQITGGAAVNYISGCDVYSNSTYGIDFGATAVTASVIKNCNIFGNILGGINSSGPTTLRLITVDNIGVGSGTVTNGTNNISEACITNNILLYSANATPWVNPTNANFTPLTGAIGRAAGFATFLQSDASSPTNTVSYPDIGAAQGASTNASPAGGGEHSHVFAQ